MNSQEIKEKIKIAKEAVADQEEPYKTEAFKIVLSQLLGSSITQSKQHEPPVKTATTNENADTGSFGGYSGVSKHIYAIMQEGFFDQPRPLKETRAELERKGCFYDIRLIDNSLRKVFMKNNKLLTRVKNGSRWAYVIRK